LKDFLIKINQLNDTDYSLIQIFKWFVLKEKSIYVELNKLQSSDKILMGLFWCPLKYKNELEERLTQIRAKGDIDGP
jgi:hypothetical protein